MARIRKVDHTSLPGIQSVPPEKRYLYVIREAGGDNYKIGIAGHPLRRLSTLQCGNPRTLEIVAAYAGGDADCSKVERIALVYFQARPGREWVYSDDLHTITRFLDAFCGEAS